MHFSLMRDVNKLVTLVLVHLTLNATQGENPPLIGENVPGDPTSFKVNL